MLHKNRNTMQLYNCWPITCLSTIYKLFTSQINNKIYKHCDTNHILEEEQKGCIWKCLGCKEQLTINVSSQTRTREKAQRTCVMQTIKKCFTLCPTASWWSVRNIQNLPKRLGTFCSSWWEHGGQTCGWIIKMLELQTLEK